jgi:raffinose/stachyose/melibiose transport system substrate-binding protein
MHIRFIFKTFKMISERELQILWEVYIMQKFLCLVLSVFMCLTFILTGCGQNNGTQTEGSSPNTAQNSGVDTNSQTADNKSAEKVTLTLYHYYSEGQEVHTEMIKRFEQANPNIVVKADLSGGDQYKTMLKTKFAANEAADIVGVHPGVGDAITYAKAGYLEDLTNESFLKNIDEGALRMATYDGKVYALPLDASYIATYYNKDIFSKLNLGIPKTWQEFVSVCEKLKQNQITPIALGNKDLWVTQFIPYALTPTVIYSKNINFDKDMYEGKAKFNGPEWTKTMDMYMELYKNNYFNEGSLSTTYDQALALFAQGKTAMLIMGTFALKPIKDLNKDLKIGLFVTPASDDGNNWAASAVAEMIGISASSKFKPEAKKFLDFYMQQDNYKYYLNNTFNFPTVKGMTVDFDPTVAELLPQITNTYNFLDQNWPAGVQDVFLKGYQEFFAGKPASDVLSDVDKEWMQVANK